MQFHNTRQNRDKREGVLHSKSTYTFSPQKALSMSFHYKHTLSSSKKSETTLSIKQRNKLYQSQQKSPSLSTIHVFNPYSSFNPYQKRFSFSSSKILKSKPICFSFSKITDSLESNNLNPYYMGTDERSPKSKHFNSNSISSENINIMSKEFNNTKTKEYEGEISYSKNEILNNDNEENNNYDNNIDIVGGASLTKYNAENMIDKGNFDYNNKEERVKKCNGQEQKIKNSTTKIEEGKVLDVYKRRILDDSHPLKGGQIILKDGDIKNKNGKKVKLNKQDRHLLQSKNNGKNDEKKVSFKEEFNEYYLTSEGNEKDNFEREESELNQNEDDYYVNDGYTGNRIQAITNNLEGETRNKKIEPNNENITVDKTLRRKQFHEIENKVYDIQAHSWENKNSNSIERYRDEDVNEEMHKEEIQIRKKINNIVKEIKDENFEHKDNNDGKQLKIFRKKFLEGDLKTNEILQPIISEKAEEIKEETIKEKDYQKELVFDDNTKDIIYTPTKYGTQLGQNNIQNKEIELINREITKEEIDHNNEQLVDKINKDIKSIKNKYKVVIKNTISKYENQTNMTPNNEEIMIETPLKEKSTRKKKQKFTENDILFNYEKQNQLNKITTILTQEKNILEDNEQVDYKTNEKIVEKGNNNLSEKEELLKNQINQTINKERMIETQQTINNEKLDDIINIPVQNNIKINQKEKSNYKILETTNEIATLNENDMNEEISTKEKVVFKNELSDQRRVLKRKLFMDDIVHKQCNIGNNFNNTNVMTHEYNQITDNIQICEPKESIITKKEMKKQTDEPVSALHILYKKKLSNPLELQSIKYQTKTIQNQHIPSKIISTQTDNNIYSQTQENLDRSEYTIKLDDKIIEQKINEKIVSSEDDEDEEDKNLSIHEIHTVHKEINKNENIIISSKETTTKIENTVPNQGNENTLDVQMNKEIEFNEIKHDEFDENDVQVLNENKQTNNENNELNEMELLQKKLNIKPEFNNNECSIQEQQFTISSNENTKIENNIVKNANINLNEKTLNVFPNNNQFPLNISNTPQPIKSTITKQTLSPLTAPQTQKHPLLKDTTPNLLEKSTLINNMTSPRIQFPPINTFIPLGTSKNNQTFPNSSSETIIDHDLYNPDIKEDNLNVNHFILSKQPSQPKRKSPVKTNLNNSQHNKLSRNIVDNNITYVKSNTIKPKVNDNNCTINNNTSLTNDANSNPNIIPKKIIDLSKFPKKSIMSKRSQKNLPVELQLSDISPTPKKQLTRNQNRSNLNEITKQQLLLLNPPEPLTTPSQSNTPFSPVSTFSNVINQPEKVTNISLIQQVSPKGNNNFIPVSKKYTINHSKLLSSITSSIGTSHRKSKTIQKKENKQQENTNSNDNKEISSPNILSSINRDAFSQYDNKSTIINEYNTFDTENSSINPSSGKRNQNKIKLCSQRKPIMNSIGTQTNDEKNNNIIINKKRFEIKHNKKQITKKRLQLKSKPNLVKTSHTDDKINKKTKCSQLTAINIQQTKPKSKQLNLLGKCNNNNCLLFKREPVTYTNKAISLSKSPLELKFIYSNISNTQRNKPNHLKHLDIPNTYSYSYTEQSYYNMDTQNAFEPLYYFTNTFNTSNYHNSITTEKTNLFNLTYELNSEDEY